MAGYGHFAHLCGHLHIWLQFGKGVRVALGLWEWANHRDEHRGLSVQPEV